MKKADHISATLNMNQRSSFSRSSVVAYHISMHYINCLVEGNLMDHSSGAERLAGRC